MSDAAGINTGKQSGAPKLSNSFDSGKKPADASAPGGIANRVADENRGKDGTR